VEAAARAAEIHDFIESQPLGYDTNAGERGSLMSGGQRQRIAIARALVRDPAILLLDEATSALDHTTETAILATLHRAAAGRTVISVTHRLSSAVDADLVLVMAGGELVEAGGHEILRRLWNEPWSR
jgi:ATP-binding cassette subfamily B protein